MEKTHIPGFAYIDAQVICHPESRVTHQSVIKKIENQYDVETGSLGDGNYRTIRVLSLLYLLIVVPKEIWKLDKNHEIYKKIASIWNLNNVTIIQGSNSFSSPIYAFIHHLRNAIAHANFDFKDDSFEFWDKNGYRAKLSLDDMKKFLEKIGRLLANFGRL